MLFYMLFFGIYFPFASTKWYEFMITMKLIRMVKEWKLTVLRVSSDSYYYMYLKDTSYPCTNKYDYNDRYLILNGDELIAVFTYKNDEYEPWWIYKRVKTIKNDVLLKSFLRYAKGKYDSEKEIVLRKRAKEKKKLQEAKRKEEAIKFFNNL